MQHKTNLNINNMFTPAELAQHDEFDKLSRRRARRARPKKVVFQRYQFDSAIEMPKVGEVVAVCHRSEQNDKGEAREVRTNVDFMPITAVYMSDSEGYTVRVRSGDTYHVRPASIGSAKWETFRPGEKQKVLV